MVEDIQNGEVVEQVVEQVEKPAEQADSSIVDGFVPTDAYKELEALMNKNSPPVEVASDSVTADKPVDAATTTTTTAIDLPADKPLDIANPEYEKLVTELGLSKAEDGQIYYDITPDDIKTALNEEYKELGFEFKGDNDLKDILVDYKQLKEQADKLSQISKEDLNMIAAIKKVGLDQYSLINSVNTEGKSPEEILWTKYRLDNPKKSLALAQHDFQTEVMASFENYNSEELKSEAIQIASENAKQSIDTRKSELATLAPDIKQNQGPSQEEIKAHQNAYADQYFSLVDKSLGEVKETVPQPIRNEKGEELGKINIALSKEEKEFVQRNLDYSVTDYLNRGVDLSKLNINQIRDALISSVVKDKAVYEAYKQGLSDKEAADLKKKLNVDADIQTTRLKDDSEQRPMTLQEKEAWMKQQNPKAFN